MEKDNGFKYTYKAPTAEERREIESIRRQYMPKSTFESDADRLRRLHSAVVNPATCIALALGVIGTLVFGLGMACVLEWSMILVGIILAVVGAALALSAYPAYNFVLARGKAKHGAEILRLSEAILDSKGGCPTSEDIASFPDNQ